MTPNRSSRASAAAILGPTFGDTTTVSNCTIANNTSSTAGGGAVVGNGGTLTLKNNILVNNTSGASVPDNCFSTVSSSGYNLIDTSIADCAAFNQTGDMVSTSASLGALIDNGGPALTMLPAVGSAAINAGTNTDCPATDQRGYTRPVGGTCDIGAVEMQ